MSAFTRKHFFIIGGQRCGTSFLAETINQCPDIRFASPSKPEPKFFLNKNQSYLSKKNYYQKHFKGFDDAIVYGEKSTSYIEESSSIKNIQTIFPDAKFIISLRNPVDRAISNYFFSVNNNLENRNIENVFLNSHEDIRYMGQGVSVNPFNYLERGKYVKYIKNISKFVNKKNLLIVFFEEFTTNIKYHKKIFSFLEVDYVPSKMLEKINRSSKSSSIIKDIRIHLNNYYKPYNMDLSDFIQRDLNNWKCHD